MMVDSRATTGCPLDRAAETSGDTFTNSTIYTVKIKKISKRRLKVIAFFFWRNWGSICILQQILSWRAGDGCRQSAVLSPRKTPFISSESRQEQKNGIAERKTSVLSPLKK
ncbi:hypothetical protein SLE2022_005320 [Rubroshorea leprosula]